MPYTPATSQKKVLQIRDGFREMLFKARDRTQGKNNFHTLRWGVDAVANP